MGVTGIGENPQPCVGGFWRNPTAPDTPHMRGIPSTAAPRVIACDKREAFAQGSDSDEAIHFAAQRKSGLLRFARNDGEIPKLHNDCHTPRRRGIQYAAAYRFYHRRLWNTGSPAFAGDDN
jgi:hypothetical protein